MKNTILVLMFLMLPMASALEFSSNTPAGIMAANAGDNIMISIDAARGDFETNGFECTIPLVLNISDNLRNVNFTGYCGSDYGIGKISYQNERTCTMIHILGNDRNFCLGNWNVIQGDLLYNSGYCTVFNFTEIDENGTVVNSIIPENSIYTVSCNLDTSNSSLPVLSLTDDRTAEQMADHIEIDGIVYPSLDAEITAGDVGRNYTVTAFAVNESGIVESFSWEFYLQINEICDGIDNDNDGEIDENLTNQYYADSDGDGYGSLANVTYACSAPAGYITDSTDCNDNNNIIHPGASEFCDGDRNCNNNDGNACAPEEEETVRHSGGGGGGGGYVPDYTPSNPNTVVTAKVMEEETSSASEETAAPEENEVPLPTGNAVAPLTGAAVTDTGNSGLSKTSGAIAIIAIIVLVVLGVLLFNNLRK